MRTVLGIAASLLLAVTASMTPALAAGAPGKHEPTWQPVGVDTDQQFRGLDATDRRHAWVSGSAGGVWKTSDGGTSWTDVSPPEAVADGLLLRDVEILGPGKVLVLSIGEGGDSRIFRTTDGGRTWTQPFVNDDDAAFYDCLAMWPGGKRGLAMSDPVDGKFRILETRDGGASWDLVDPDGMPDAVEGEFGFAASGTCLVTAGARHAWLASGGGASRVFHSSDRGHTWTVAESTIPASPAGGVFSLAFRNPRTGLAVGGDFLVPDNGVDMSAYSRDGGRSWSNGGDLAGYRSGVDWLSGARATAVAVGPTGSDITRDGGRTWTAFDDAAYDAVVCAADGSCWASGPAGAVATLKR